MVVVGITQEVIQIEGYPLRGRNAMNEINLSDQEITVMRLVAEGKANAVIAREIFTSEKTIERVLSRIYFKYGIAGSSKTENPRVKATLIFCGLIHV